MDLQPQAITAFLVGLKSKVATFALQREVNDYPGEPLMAILPGVAPCRNWGLMGTAEKALFVVSLFVVLTGLIGMLTAILTSLNERRREMAILRSVGARPGTSSACCWPRPSAWRWPASPSASACSTSASPPASYVQANYGIYLPLAWPSNCEWSLLGAILAAAVLIGCVPAWRAYRQSLADGLSIRL